MTKKLTARTATVKIVLRLLKQQGSLASELSLLNSLEEQEKRFAQELCYGVCRWYFLLESILNNFVDKPIKEKDSDIKLLLLLGIYQLQFTRVAPHAAINETVNAAVFFRKQWAKKLINGVLRSFQRQQESNAGGIDHSLILASNKSAHPLWLQQAILSAWPEQAETIFQVNNQHPPFTLRINQQQSSVDDYKAILGNIATPTSYSPFGLTLDTPCDVTQLSGFAQGMVSVQDEAAQLAAELLQLQPNLRVLDACCAPGGKTCHIGEMQPDIKQLVTIDIEERRLVRVRENLSRLFAHTAIDIKVLCGDCTQPESWWDGQLFDRILLDAPCSATGVLRRHPDIKLLRTPEAVNDLAVLQLHLLNALWPLLADGGIVVYATCSVLPQENTRVIEQFLTQHENVVHDAIVADWGVEQPYGRQLLPQQNGHDGFYYARLKKINKTR
jgi:16S rRNA (cytosine967-C5)-methyltransferase